MIFNKIGDVHKFNRECIIIAQFNATYFSTFYPFFATANLQKQIKLIEYL